MSPRGLSSLLVLSLLLTFLSLVLSQSYKCQNDDDCSLNGLCDSSTAQCTCDPGWTGFDCGILDRAPAVRGSGYNMTANGTSSWGGKPILDPSTGKWLLFAAEFTGGCGLDYWSPMSRIIRAVSADGPAGPYMFEKELVGTFAHNPTVIWSEADGVWLMYHIGCPYTQPTTCQEGGIMCDDANNNNGESSISLRSSTDLSEWTSLGVALGPNTNGTWDQDTTNPSPFPLYTPDNNSTAILLAYRGCGYNCDSSEMLNLAIARNYSGPYHRLHDKPIFPDSNEDPFVWRDKRGHWHMLMHSLEAGGGFGEGPKIGRHAYAHHFMSTWTFGNRTLAFNTTTEFTDGTSTDYYRRERPQLVFSDDGEMTPLYLTNGVQEANTPASYTLIQPLTTAAEWEKKHGYGQHGKQQQRQNRHAKTE